MCDVECQMVLLIKPSHSEALALECSVRYNHLCSNIPSSSSNAGFEMTVSHSESAQHDKPSATLQSPANPAGVKASANTGSDALSHQHQRPADGGNAAPGNCSLYPSPHAVPSLVPGHTTGQDSSDLSVDDQAPGHSALNSQHMSLVPPGEQPVSHAAVSTNRDAAGPQSAPESSGIHALGSSAAATGDKEATTGLASEAGRSISLATENLAGAVDIRRSTEKEFHAEEPALARAEQQKAAPAAQQIYASGFTTGAGKQVNLTARGKAKADKLLAGDATAAQLEPEASAVGLPQGSLTASKGKSPDMPVATSSAAAHVPSGFATGLGKAVKVSAGALAEARKLLQQSPSAGQHPAGHHLAAGQHPVAGQHPAGHHPAAAGQHPAEARPAAVPAVAASGFTSGTGKPIQTSAAARARAQRLLEDGSNVAQTAAVGWPLPVGVPAASGFTTGTGKKVQPSAAAQARAKQLLEGGHCDAQESAKAGSLPVSTAAPTASGFTSGTGKAVLLSAAAQAEARDLLSDENTTPQHPTAPSASASAAAAAVAASADIDHVSTSAGIRKADVKRTGVRPVLGTPRTGPTAARPVLKRVQELSKSTGGKLFKKPRMSKIMTPVCPGATPCRVMLLLGLILLSKQQT